MKYTKKDLVLFGEYLLSKKRKQKLKEVEGLDYKTKKRFVFDADIENFKTQVSVTE